MGSRVSKSLLAKGFFPKELPSIFSSKDFANSVKNLRARKFGDSKQWTSCDSYSMPHSKAGRRVAALANPVPFFAASELLSSNWKQIARLYQGSKFSFSRPKFNSKFRAVASSDFEGYRESLVTRASGYSYVLHADFSRYFPTLYTHAVEWSIHGKAYCKANLKKKGAAKQQLWGGALDTCLQRMQDGQTQGIPIGPDTSYIVAELMGAAIDREFLRIYGRAVVGSRLIDDYALFFESRTDAEEAHTALLRAAGEFQIALNDEKTYVETVRGGTKERWVYQLNAFGSSHTAYEQRREILRYTDLAVDLTESAKKPSAARYAATVFARHTVHQKNIDLLIACLLRLAAHAPEVIPILVDAVVGYHKIGYKINKKPIETYLRTSLARMIDLGQDKESIWLLWLSICLRIRIDVLAVNAVKRTSCSFVVLLARCAQEKGLCRNVKQGVFASRLTEGAFHSKNWLLAYEGAMRGWFGWKQSDIFGSILETLAKQNVKFLDFTAEDISRITRRTSESRKQSGVGGVGGADAESHVEDWGEVEFDDLDDLIDIDTDVDSGFYGSRENQDKDDDLNELGDEDEDEDEDDDDDDLTQHPLGYQ